jgi:hypothetical protein
MVMSHFYFFRQVSPPKNNNSKKFYYKKNTPLVGFALGEIMIGESFSWVCCSWGNQDWGEF